MLLRRFGRGVVLAVLLAGSLTLAGAADAKTGCPKDKDKKNSGSQYPPGQCKAKTDKSSVPQGDEFGASGDGFAAGEQVEYELHSVTLEYGSILASPSGTTSRTLVVPADFPIGDHTVTLYGVRSGTYLTAGITVTPRALPRVDTGGSDDGGLGLPRTGTEILATAAGGAAVVAIGTGLVVAARRRRRPAAAS